MVTPLLSRRRITVSLLGLGLVAGLFLVGPTLLAHYEGWRLRSAEEDDKMRWVEKLASRGEESWPVVRRCLRSEDEMTARSAAIVIDRLTGDWTDTQGDWPALAAQLDRATPSQPARLALLDRLPLWLRRGGAPATDSLRPLVRSGLADPDPVLRSRAVSLCAMPLLQLRGETVLLTHDPDPGVRRAAIALTGTRPADGEPGLTDEELGSYLHDTDLEVRRLSRLALTSRGLKPRDIDLLSRLTHPDLTQRLQLLLDLPSEDDINLASWLDRLSQDTSPSVRAGAARLAVENRVVFRDQLEKMRQVDPDGTVRQIADHYLQYMPRETTAGLTSSRLR